jgi:tripartite ATP-independent transporter DctM subunit
LNSELRTEPASIAERAVAVLSGPLLQLSALLIMAIVGLIAVDITGRTLFDTPLRGVPELVSVLIPAIVFLALPYLGTHDRLITSDVLLSALARRNHAAASALRFIYAATGAAIALTIATLTGADLVAAIRTLEFIGVEGDFTVPVWPAKLAITAGSALLGIAAAGAAVRHARGNRLVVVALAIVTVAAILVGTQDERAAAGGGAIALMFALIYAGMPVAFALASTATLGLVAIKPDPIVALNTLALVADSAVSDYVFAAVPLFVLMGLIVGAADIGRDSLAAAHWLLRRLQGGLGVATVGANAVFAAITGISIASAAIFSRIAVPPLVDHGFTRRFAVGLVAGSSVLGMLIPPSLLLIVYGLVAEVSINRLFIAAIVPGLVLTLAFAIGVVAVATLRPRFAVTAAFGVHDGVTINGRTALVKMIPVALLVVAVLGGIYGGIFTPTEAGASGSLAAMALALVMRRTTLRTLGQLLQSAAASAASILFLIIAASAFAIMLTLSGIPESLSASIAGANLGITAYAFCYLVVLIILGMVLDSTSILLIMVPLALPAVRLLGGDLVWFGIITVIGVEIGLLTPPLGLSVYAIKASLDDETITLNDIFRGALPFTIIMLAVTALLIFCPWLTSWR